jgi:hypothetical protein
LLQFSAELLAGRSPVVGDIVTEVLHVALEVYLILLQPADIELLARSATLKLSSDVFLVVTNDPA